MNKLTITTIVINNQTGHVAVTMHSIDFESSDALKAYVENCNKTKPPPLDITIHQTFEAICNFTI